MFPFPGLVINNSVGTANNCIFSLISGNDYITCNNLNEVLTEVVGFYVGSFSLHRNVGLFVFKPTCND
jgi:hypothetical protein